MNFLAWLGKKFDEGWFSRALLIFQFWFVYWIVDWSMALGSTALYAKVAAAPGSGAASVDLLGVAAIIGAVAAIPQALLMLATNKYMEMRAQQPTIIKDRRTP